MLKQVAVTGIGIHSALGFGLENNSAALQAGKSGVVVAPESWREQRLQSQVCGNINAEGLLERFDRKQRRFLCEAALYAAAAMQDAIADAGLSDDQVQHPDTGLIIGTGAGASIDDVMFLCDRVRKRGASKVGAYHVPVIMGSSLSANLGQYFQTTRSLVLNHFSVCDVRSRNHVGNGYDPFGASKTRIRRRGRRHQSVFGRVF